MFEARHLHWKYWEPRADWQGSRSYVLSREVAAICSEPLLAAALQRCGFHARASQPLLVRASGVRLPAAGIRIRMLDDDSA